MDIDFEQLKSERRAKWARILEGGFQQVPHVLFKHQAQLGLNSNDLVILLNIMLHWWEPSEHPYPRTSTIVSRMGVDKRTAQRSLSKLQELGLIQKIETQSKNKTETLKAYDLTGLLIKLTELTEKDSSFIIRSWLKQKRSTSDIRAEQIS